MSEIARRNTPDRTRAAGLVAPAIRAVQHLGYLIGAISEMEQDAWDQQQTRSDLLDELNQALRHTDDVINLDPGAYVTQDTVDAFVNARSDITDFAAAIPESKDEAVRSLQNISHNFTYAGALFDHDCSGLITSEGSMS